MSAEGACVAEALAQPQQAVSAAAQAGAAQAQQQPQRRLLGQLLCRLTVLSRCLLCLALDAPETRVSMHDLQHGRCYSGHQQHIAASL